MTDVHFTKVQIDALRFLKDEGAASATDFSRRNVGIYGMSSGFSAFQRLARKGLIKLDKTRANSSGKGPPEYLYVPTRLGLRMEKYLSEVQQHIEENEDG